MRVCICIEYNGSNYLGWQKNGENKTLCQEIEKAFEMVGYSKEVVKERFSSLYNAFQYGAPPHAGMAPGTMAEKPQDNPVHYP